MMGRRAAVISIAVLVAVSPPLAFGSAPADAHGNHVTAGSQVSADGTVVVEELFLLEDGYLVIHENEGDDPGDILGHVALNSGYHRGVTVSLDESWWADVANNESVTAVLHRDEGGDEFDPEEDTPISSFGSVAGAEFTVRKGDSPVNVVASSFSGHPVEDSVTVRRAQLADDGYLVVRANGDDGPGDVVGQESVAAGTHENVTVSVDRDAFDAEETNVYLWVSVYRDDGDGTFDDGADEPVTVAGSPVQSRIVAQLNASESGMDVGVNTPEPTTGGDGTTATPSDGESGDETGGEETGMPAVGVVGTVVALLAGILLAVRRR